MVTNVWSNNPPEATTRALNPKSKAGGLGNPKPYTIWEMSTCILYLCIRICIEARGNLEICLNFAPANHWLTWFSKARSDKIRYRLNADTMQIRSGNIRLNKVHISERKEKDKMRWDTDEGKHKIRQAEEKTKWDKMR